MTTAPNPPFIAARYHGGSQVPKAIVMHATVSPDNAGTARSIANWWHGPSSPRTSAHYVVDPAEVIQCVGDHTVAYHCGVNQDCIGIELCDEQTGPASRWADADSKAILARAARLTAQLCLAYNIEPRRPSIAELKAKGKHGIYGHNDSRLAFGNTTHTDPKDFPWDSFIAAVRGEHARLKGGQQPTYLDLTIALSRLAERSQNPDAKPIYLKVRTIVGKLVADSRRVRVPATTREVIAALAYKRTNSRNYWTKYRLTRSINLLKPLV